MGGGFGGREGEIDELFLVALNGSISFVVMGRGFALWVPAGGLNGRSSGMVCVVVLYPLSIVSLQLEHKLRKTVFRRWR